MPPLGRGALIILEGCDCTGKTTLSRKLAEQLQMCNVATKHMSFPDRSSNIGQVINAYLRSQNTLVDEVIHLLFSANRWEFKQEMQKLLESGTTLIVDRYSYSGIAYSVAKGMPYDWCLGPEKGLLRPDAVFYLKAPIELLQQRGGFGNERYEKIDFQRKVAEVFERIGKQEQNYWQEVDASQTLDVVLEELESRAMQVVTEAREKPFMQL